MMIRSLIHATSVILASTVLALSLAAAPARAATITINGSSCNWDSTAQALTCSSNTGGGSAPSGCTLSANPATLPANGGTVLLSGSCSGGGAPTSYAWSGPGLASSTASNSQSTNITQSSSFSVTPSNAAGSGNAASVTVTVASGGGGGGGGAGLANCTAQNFTVVGGNATPVTWGAGGVWYSSSGGAFGDNAVWVFALTVPAGTPPSASNGYFSIGEFGTAPTPRQLTISTQACDFRAFDFSGANGPLGVCNNGTSCRVLYSIQTPSLANLFSGIAGLTAGTTYYISARNWSSSGSSCGGSNCSAVMNEYPSQ